MVSHAVWKTWPSGLSYDKNLGPSASVFVYWVPWAMFFTRHGRPWSNPTTNHYLSQVGTLGQCDGSVSLCWPGINDRTEKTNLICDKLLHSLLIFEVSTSRYRFHWVYHSVFICKSGILVLGHEAKSLQLVLGSDTRRITQRILDQDLDLDPWEQSSVKF